MKRNESNYPLKITCPKSGDIIKKILRALMLLSILTIFYSCGSTTNKVDNMNQSNDSKLKNGLLKAMSGKWINKALFDSTLKKRQISPWFRDFVGDLVLIIENTDSVNDYGNSDGGINKIVVIDSISFLVPDRIDKPIYKYDPKIDLIAYQVSSNHKIVFRRVKNDDQLDIIANQEKFDKYFINKFFGSTNLKDQIVSISDGFESSAPYDFDAFSLKDSNDKETFYAWKIVADTLKIYFTSSTYNKHEYLDYKIEKLKETIILKK